MKKFSDEDIVLGLRKRDNHVIDFIYQHYFDSVAKMVVNNSGSSDDAEDIFQEALIIVFKKLNDGEELTLTSSFSTYIYSICRLMWLKKLRDSQKLNLKKLNREEEEFIEFEEPPPVQDKDLRYAIYQKALMQIPEDCQKILTLIGEKLSHKEVAKKLGFRSDNYVKKRKHFCKEFLVNKIKEDAEYRDLMAD